MCFLSEFFLYSVCECGVCVPVPPRLAPFSFAAGTRAGMRAQVTCLVQEGDQPLTHAWRKDGQPLDPSLDIRHTQLDPFTSILVIDRVTAAHSGNYTCAVTNAARTTSTTARLTVSGRPPTVSCPPVNELQTNDREVCCEKETEYDCLITPGHVLPCLTLVD